MTTFLKFSAVIGIIIFITITAYLFLMNQAVREEYKPIQKTAASQKMIWGVNVAGAEFGENNLPGIYEKDYIYPTVNELEYFASKGLSYIRLPFKWERMQPELFGPLDETELQRLDTLINQSEPKGIIIIPEPHNFGRYRVPNKANQKGCNEKSECLIGSDAVPVAAFSDFWEKFATRMKDHKNIYAYDLINEPHDTNGLWPETAQSAVNAIRKVDKEKYIFVPGDGWSLSVNWQKYNNNLKIEDPFNKVVYEAHVYFDKNHSGRYKGSYEEEGGSANVGSDRLKPFITWLKENKAKGFIGEYGVPENDPRWLTTLDNTLQTIQTNNDVLIGGAYWAGGPWWGSQSLSIEPNKDGSEKPQLKILTKFIN